jgi:hypothetical protein
MSWQGFEKSSYELEGLGRSAKGEKRPHFIYFSFFKDPSRRGVQLLKGKGHFALMAR